MVIEEARALEYAAKEPGLAPWERTELRARAEELRWRAQEGRRLANELVEACSDPAEGRKVYSELLGRRESVDEQFLVELRGRLANAGLIERDQLCVFDVVIGPSPERAEALARKRRESVLFDAATAAISELVPRPRRDDARRLWDRTTTRGTRSWARFSEWVELLCREGLLDRRVDPRAVARKWLVRHPAQSDKMRRVAEVK